METIQAEDQRRIDSGKRLDSILSDALAEADKSDEFADFVSSRPARDELKTRHGADTAGIVKRFASYQGALAENPEVGAELIRGDYLSRSNLATLRHAEQSENTKPVTPPTATEEQPGRKLDRILEGALDEHFDGKHDADRAEMEAARPEFEALKKANPALTWGEFFQNTVHADRSLWRNPDNAYRLAAVHGVEV
jgi:hypothetical protein